MHRSRKINMNIHHKNMKQISEHMQLFTQSSLHKFGIFECSYGYYNLKKNLWMGMSSNYDWYCSYLELSCEQEMHKRLKPGFNYWKKSDQLYAKYKSYLSHDQDPYKCDIVVNTQVGYESLTVASNQLLTKYNQVQLEKVLRKFSYEAHKIIKTKANILLDFSTPSVLNKLSDQNNDSQHYSEYDKSKYGHIILTSKEQKYIEYLVFNLTHKEIAYQEHCSETAVRKIITNIKRKMGCEYMSQANMMLKLNELGVLSIISQSFK